MILDVSRALANPGQSYPFDGMTELPEMEILEDTVQFTDIHLEGTFTGSGESVSVRGTVTATVQAHCARCLEPVSAPVHVSFNEVFVKTPDPEDPDLYPLEGHTIDLTDLAKDAILLEIPMRYLCREDCLGLCPICGSNRNKTRCTCQEGGTVLPNPFSALGEMLLKDEEV